MTIAKPNDAKDHQRATKTILTVDSLECPLNSLLKHRVAFVLSCFIGQGHLVREQRWCFQFGRSSDNSGGDRCEGWE